MRQAITTKYLCPTNTRGSRIKARASAGSVTTHWDHADNIEGNHCRAAKLLAAKYGWAGYWVGGGMPTEDGNVFVWIGDDIREDYLGNENRDWFHLPPKQP